MKSWKFIWAVFKKYGLNTSLYWVHAAELEKILMDGLERSSEEFVLAARWKGLVNHESAVFQDKPIIPLAGFNGNLVDDSKTSILEVSPQLFPIDIGNSAS